MEQKAQKFVFSNAVESFDTLRVPTVLKSPRVTHYSQPDPLDGGHVPVVDVVFDSGGKLWREESKVVHPIKIN